MEGGGNENNLMAEAVAVYRNVVGAGSTFMPCNAMVAVGINQDVAITSTYNAHFAEQFKVIAITHDFGPRIIEQDETSKVERAAFLHKKIVDNVPIINNCRKSQALCMRLAGFKDDETRAGKFFMRVSRAIKQSQREDAEAEHVGDSDRVIDLTNPVVDLTNPTGPISPLSVCTGPTQASTRTGSSASSPISVSSHQPSITSPQFWPAAPASARPAHRPSVVSQHGPLRSLTTSTNHRRTTKSIHHERKDRQELKDIQKCALKLGTVLWDGVNSKANNLKHLTDADACATAINTLMKVELVSGRELMQAVKRGDVNKSPPRKGRPSSIIEEEFDAIKTLVWTASSIEQANTGERLTRSKLRSAVGNLVNDKRKKDGAAELGDVKLYERIEKENARLQDHEFIDPREALRVQWLTYNMQKKHYENFEDAMIEDGFARRATPEEIEADGVYLVYYEGQDVFFANIDGMKFSLDGSATQSGGRPSATPSDTNLPETGTSAPKSSKSLTVVIGITGAGEVFPAFFIFPTDAKDKANYKLSTRMLPGFRQNEGQYGYQRRMWHDAMIGINPKGGMNSEMWVDYYLNNIMPLFPEAQDVPGKRVLIKTDSGPGRNDEAFLAGARASGFIHYAGLPNGTTVGQECDQVFGYFKQITSRNLDTLYRARQVLNGEGAALTSNDVGYSVYGGTVTLDDGTEVVLESAFDMAFTPELIKRAYKKCGYCPATRNALDSNQIRHEIVMDEEGEVDDEADPYGRLLSLIEERNHEACAFLTMAGYDATLLRRSVRRVTANQTRGRAATVTEPNTRERQDALMEVSTAGQFFQVTGGGGPGNSSDVLIARARKRILVDSEKLQKKKEAYETFATIEAEGRAILESSKPFAQWTVPDLRAVLRWKQGLTPPSDEKVYAMNKPPLKTLYATKYAEIDPVPMQWTDGMEVELQRLKAGKIDLYIHTELKRAFEREDEYLLRKMGVIGRSRRKQVLIALLSSLEDEEEKRDLVADLNDA